MSGMPYSASIGTDLLRVFNNLAGAAQSSRVAVCLQILRRSPDPQEQKDAQTIEFLCIEFSGKRAPKAVKYMKT